MKTLWQRLFGPRDVPTKLIERYNPLNVKSSGSIINIGLTEYDDRSFFVKGIKEVSRKINKVVHKFADYDLEDHNGEKYRLRFYPDGQLLILDLYEDMKFSDDLWQICLNDSEFHVTDNDNNIEEVYWRIGDVKTTQECKVILDDGSEKTKEYRMDYWDYSRITKDEANQDFEQYLFIEMDKDSGRCKMWRGKVINRERIMVI